MSDTIELLRKEYPRRAFALKTSTHVLTLEHTPEKAEYGSRNDPAVPRCAVEFTNLETAQLEEYRSLRTEVLNYRVHGTLGLINLNNDIFLCVVSSVSPRPIIIRPGESVRRIESVDFHCLSSTAYDRLLNEQINPYSTDYVDDEGFDGHGNEFAEHPCMALKKLLSSGTFYYSSDFDLTRRLQKRITDEEPSIAYESLDAGFLWNSFMIQPLIDFRSRLSHQTRDELDATRILTSVIRGFCSEIIIPAPSAPLQRSFTGEPTRLTIISRLSCRRAGTRFNARGIDDEGNVANYVETELNLWSPVGEEKGEVFSYVQVRGSLPIFWEQQSSLNPLQQPKITITRSPEATQPAFDKHFQNLDHSYGAVHVMNLLSGDRKKPGEIELTQRFEDHIRKSELNNEKDGEHQLLSYTHYDFHAETKGPQGLAGATSIVDYIGPAARSFGYLYAEDRAEHVKIPPSMVYSTIRRATPILQQDGVFRTNCLDCLDRTNYVQTLISQLVCEFYLEDRGVGRAPPDFWARHSTLWADNGDALSRMYAGTGALNTSATRHGKLTIGGILSDARKSASRLYINNFADKGRQNTIDMLLGRLLPQQIVHLYDPINDWVQMELRRHAAEYTSTKTINVYVGTLNLNGKLTGLKSDLSPWLCPPLGPSQKLPEIAAIAFQEIVELNPQQLMKEDPHTRLQWEQAVLQTLNRNATSAGSSEYVLLRSGQLVGAALLIFVQRSKLKRIKNVEGATKKTGLSGMAGNKGAVAIRMDYANTSLCFVTAHLAAGFSNYEDRNRDYRTISQGLRFQRNRKIDDHDSVFWFGDFNYRIGLSNDKVRYLIDRGDLDTLLENDQLYIQRTRSSVSNVFDHYDEAKITFLPTYKFDIGTDTYDTSEKGRIPAWTDRVLRKGNNIRQIQYNSAPLRFSDHRPVYATFEVDVTLVDEKVRDELNAALYKKRKQALGDGTASTVTDQDEDDLLGFEPVQSGWPPASSDRQKWWLDNGLPAHSTLKPPGRGYVPNPSRPANPFVPSDEPDWVKVDSVASSSNITRSSSVASGTAPRKLPPPFEGNGSPQLPPRRNTLNEDAPPSRPSVSPSPSMLSLVSSGSGTTSRKAPPAVKPKKPSLLGTPVSPSSVDGESERRCSVASKAASPPAVPPPRRSMVMRGGPPTASNEDDTAPPPLPSRTGTALAERSQTGLMDETDEGAMNGLSNWEVLRPG
ncbi:uncharacterized protein PV09_06851 [Verruconis gallopava]|uniref:phosphoinositide 5-phosphatase n=1 Tax=Verruconis gallopava TaxID=253628 RepID=A0A0D1YLG1_9PEZI|nr:uncharacterized protein PV09_06851 [Verruconis gallopava]KIW01667.1 hypothetical protein PV09_06851 [Verruconis gallopava]